MSKTKASEKEKKGRKERKTNRKDKRDRIQVKIKIIIKRQEKQVETIKKIENREVVKEMKKKKNL